MATITRANLYQAIEECSNEFVSREAKTKLYAWAGRATSFNLGDWDRCPLDQVGLVNKFTGRSSYSAVEDTRFKHEASEIDARLLGYVKSFGLTGEVQKLHVLVV
jgi:hypothetical protein